MNTSSENNGTSYTKVVKDLNKFKELSQQLETQNNDLKNQVLDLTKENNNLTEENEQHIKDKQKIIEILKPEN